MFTISRSSSIIRTRAEPGFDSESGFKFMRRRTDQRFQAKSSLNDPLRNDQPALANFSPAVNFSRVNKLTTDQLVSAYIGSEVLFFKNSSSGHLVAGASGAC